MRLWKNKLVSGVLAAAFTCASAGCTTQAMNHPTWESVAASGWQGGSAEVVLKSGEKRRVQVTLVGEDGLHAGYDGVIAYADIERLTGVPCGPQGDELQSAVKVAVMVPLWIGLMFFAGFARVQPGGPGRL